MAALPLQDLEPADRTEHGGLPRPAVVPVARLDTAREPERTGDAGACRVLIARASRTVSSVGPEVPRLRVAVHDLAGARSFGSPGEQQRAEDEVISLLFPQTLALANTVSAGRLDPIELTRLTGAMLTGAVRACDPREWGQFRLSVIERVLARLTDRLGSGYPVVLPGPRDRRHAG